MVQKKQKKNTVKNLRRGGVKGNLNKGCQIF
jgi:hypothetical protein